MRITTSLRRVLTALAATAAVALTATGTAAAANLSGPTSTPSTSSGPGQIAEPSALHPLAELSAERLATADLVAAAKWGTNSPIDDPAREQLVLDSVAAQARQFGADPDEIRRIFRDQIEANKIVQRGLFQRWTAHPEQAPTTRPDLAVVRQEINRVTTALVQNLAGTAAARAVPTCRPGLVLAAARVRHDNRLDGLHTRALFRSLRSVCAS